MVSVQTRQRIPIPSARLPTFISNERDDHAVEVEEEHEQVEAEFDEGFLFVDVEFSKDFSGVQEVLILVYSAKVPGQRAVLQHAR